MREQVVTVLSSIGNNHVHFVQLTTGDGVGDQRSFVQRLVVRRFFNDAALNHGFERQFNAGFDHGNQQDAVVEVFLFVDFNVRSRCFFEAGFCRFFTPGQQVFIVVGPVSHHGAGEFAGHDVVLMLAEQRTHQFFQFFSHVERNDFRRVRQTVHHVGDAAVLQSFSHCFPTVLDQLGCVAFVDTVFNHFLEAQNRTGLQHAAQNGLLAHQVRLNFSNERRFQTASAVTASTGSPCFSNVPAFAFRIVFRVNSDQGRNTETTLVLFTHFRTRALRSNHHNGQVRTDLHAFFNNVETVGVTQAGAFFHQRHNSRNNSSVLLVWRQVDQQVSLWNQLFVSTNNETVVSRVFPGLTLLSDGFSTQGVRHVQTGIAHVQTLIQALSTTTNDHNFLTFQEFSFGSEFRTVHKTAAAQLIQLLTQVQSIEVVSTHLWLLKLRLCGLKNVAANSRGRWLLRKMLYLRRLVAFYATTLFRLRKYDGLQGLAGVPQSQFAAASG